MENMYSIKPVTKAVAIIVVMQMCCMQTSKGDTAVSLLQGSKGIIPCTKYPIQQSDSIWWYFGTFDNNGLIISKFKQSVEPAVGIPNGTYGINREFSLVITNVSLSNEGMYYFQILPSQPMDTTSGHIMVEVQDNHIFLERGQSVTVPYFPVVFNHHSLREKDFVYWRFQSMMDTGKPGLLVTCHFKNGTAHKTYQRSWPTGIYDVDANCSLVIVNVTDSDEGKYLYKLRPRLSSVPVGQIRAEVKDITGYSTDGLSTTEGTSTSKPRDNDESSLAPIIIAFIVFIIAVLFIAIIIFLIKKIKSSPRA